MNNPTPADRKWNERPNADAASLRNGEFMFELFFERSTDPVWLFDPRARAFTDCNQAAVALLGYGTKSELLGKRPADLSPAIQPDGRASAQAVAAIAAEVQRQGGHRFEWMARRRDGVELPLEVVATQIDIEGRPLHVLVSRDTSERKQAEVALRESQQMLASVADNISEAIYRSDANHRLTFVNRAYLKMFGYESLEELQATPRERLYAEPRVRAHLLELLARDDAFSQQEVEYVRRDGRGFWGLASARLIRDPQTGRVVYHVGAIADITGQRKASDQIRLLNTTLERRIAERTAECSASEARLRTLVEHAPEAIVVLDGRNGRFLICNDNALRLYGRSREELLQLGPADVSPAHQPDGRPSAEAARGWIAEALAGGTPVFEWTHQHRDGRLIPCEVRLVRLPGEGAPLVRGSVTDNTERHRRERIQQATYRISEAVQSVDDLSSLYPRIHESVAGLMAARNFYIALCEPVAEVFTFPYFVDEHDAAPGPMKLTTGLTGLVIRTRQTLLVNKQTQIAKSPSGVAVLAEEGRKATYEETGTPSAVWLGAPLMVRGQVLGVMAVQDYGNDQAYGEEEKQVLTFVAEQTALAIERKRAGQALRDSEARFRGLFEATSQGVLLHDDEKIFAVNPAAVRILGYANEADILGKHPAQISAPIQPDGQPALELARQHIAAALANGSARFEWLTRRQDGVEFPLEVFLTTIELGGRRIIQAVINDISERKKTEAELLRSLAREKELGQLKSNFVSTVSHEFRTPLGIIMSSAEILDDYLDQLEPEERKQHLQSIQKNSRRMADLMEEVLVLGRFEAGKMSFEPRPLPLDALCRRVADEVASVTSHACPISLSVEPAAAEADGDERLLRHIFTNLLSNAVKYSPRGTPVEFAVTRRESEAVCVIRDRGIGIPDEDREWLFGAFHRGRNVGDRPGTGLGLVIVKRCVELHRGGIRVESRLGEGTTVTVRLPLFGLNNPANSWRKS